MIIRTEDREFLKKNAPQCEEYIETDDIDELLSELNYVISLEGFDEGYVFNDFGRAVQKIYDNILYDNE